MKTWKAWLLVAVIFSIGAAAGAFGMRAYMARRLPEMLARPAERMEDRVLAHIDAEVGLSEPQRAELRPVIAAGLARVARSHESVRAEVDAALTHMDDAVAAKLDPGQRERFAELRARMEKFRRMMPPGPPPGPPPVGMPFGPPPGPPPGQ